MAEETKIVYYIGDEQTPYVSKINIPPSVITLGDFKEAIKKPNHKYFFRSKDAEFGVVKEEITNDESHLPLCEGRIVGWLVAPDVDSFSQDSGSVNSLPQQQQQQPPSVLPGNEPRPQAFMRNGMGPRDSDAESVISNHRPPHRLYDRYGGSQSTLMSSDLSTTSWDSREDTMSEYSTCTDITASSRYHKQRQKKHRYKKKRPRPGSDTTSNYSSSITDSSMSLNIVVVTLNMEKYRFLGISIVGQSNDKGDGGIYIGSIMKGGAVAADGRIEPGDMLLQVNDKNFENMSNEEAVRVLRNIVHEPGPIHLTVAKCWDPTPESMFIIPKDEPVRPIDPAAWANHTMAVRDQYGEYPGPTPSYGVNLEASSDTLANSLPESERYDIPLSIRTTMAVVVKHLKMPDSGLDVKTRMWLKITIPNAFIGSDLVEWLHQKVDGLQERRDARKYASNLLKAGYIRHTVNKITFSEQCYYVFGDHTVPMHQDMANLSLGDSNSDRDSDVLGPLPMHNKLQWGTAGGSSHGYPSYNNQQQSYHPYNPSPQLGRSGGDFVAPPPAYSCISGQSDNSDVMSVHSANGLMMHRAPSDLSLTRQHLATFDGGSGSGSDNLSESRYSSRSGRSGGSNHRAQRSHSGSEKDNQSQMSFNMGGSNSGSLRRIKNQGSMTLERPRPPLPLPRSSSQRSTTSQPVPVNPYHPSMQNVTPPGVLPPSNHGNRPLNMNQLPPENNQMIGLNQRPPGPINHMQRPGTMQAPINGQNTSAPTSNQQGRPLNQVPQGLSNSQQSFQQAMGNPCDYFVGVM